jgi:hypothetical protein
MTFLPIVERELRVAARSRFTFWSRLAAAAFALVIFIALQFIAQATRGAIGAGQLEFAILKWLAFAYAYAAGLFLTADSLSEEKREGTLGLLFLTDLRGYDVVFGKLLTQSLRAFYALLAAFPIMGLALLAGGVTGGEFWRAMLVICNTLFFSLSLGMLVSSISRDSTKALNGTLLLLVVIVGGLPLADLALAGFEYRKFEAVFSDASPGYLFSNAGGYRFSGFWICLPLQNALAWAFLVLASVLTPRSWQDKAAASIASRPRLSHRWRFGGPRARVALRQRLLAKDPMLWLSLRDRWLPRLVWTLTVIVLLIRASSLAFSFVVYSADASVLSPVLQAFLQLTTALEWLLRLALYLWIASQASRFFVDAIRNGALELLLVTPVNPWQIVRAQWAALWRTFWFPVICVVLLQLAGTAATVLQMKSYPVTSTVTMGGKTTTTRSAGFDLSVYQVTSVSVGVLTFVAGLAAAAWFGMWMGLTNRKASVALLKTICYVFVLPWIGLMFARVFIMFALIPAGIAGSPTVMLVVPMLIVGVLNLGKDCFFIWWAHLSLRVHFREKVTGDKGHRYRPSGSMPPPPAAPPVILPPGLPPAANAI